MGQLLDELAYACHLYGTVTDYDSSYVQFVTATDGAADLGSPVHRRALLA